MLCTLVVDLARWLWHCGSGLVALAWWLWLCGSMALWLDGSVALALWLWLNSVGCRTRWGRQLAKNSFSRDGWE
ncbi:hypothetical protein EJ02DRAFT_212743 [Clathrospora elynae]|uniref:Uncharacterized protein n=1 Tax=Clathrospora elynae TaxID=706981 RepID=A0A6A5S4U4_9PLEO|nr:hypothetical protein EJ02DRAFT_212743 [Clathrospora elynae]